MVKLVLRPCKPWPFKEFQPKAAQHLDEGQCMPIRLSWSQQLACGTAENEWQGQKHSSATLGTSLWAAEKGPIGIQHSPIVQCSWRQGRTVPR